MMDGMIWSILSSLLRSPLLLVLCNSPIGANYFNNLNLFSYILSNLIIKCSKSYIQQLLQRRVYMSWIPTTIVTPNLMPPLLIISKFEHNISHLIPFALSKLSNNVNSLVTRVPHPACSCFHTLRTAGDAWRVPTFPMVRVPVLL